MAKKFGTVDYCQYLLSSQINYTITNLSEQVEGHSHDQNQPIYEGKEIDSQIILGQCESQYSDG